MLELVLQLQLNAVYLASLTLISVPSESNIVFALSVTWMSHSDVPDCPAGKKVSKHPSILLDVTWHDVDSYDCFVMFIIWVTSHQGQSKHSAAKTSVVPHHIHIWWEIWSLCWTDFFHYCLWSNKTKCHLTNLMRYERKPWEIMRRNPILSLLAWSLHSVLYKMDGLQLLLHIMGQIALWFHSAGLMLSMRRL